MILMELKQHILSILIFLPLAGLAVMLAYSIAVENRDAAMRKIAFGFSLVELLVSLGLVAGFNRGEAGMQFVERTPWIRTFGFNVDYFVGVDGLSLWLVPLTTLLTCLAILASWASIQTHVRDYLSFLLLLETGLVGVFVSLDMFLFYLFWEVMLVPMYFLIGVWGGERKVYAAVKFIIYTMAGSVLMLVAIISLYYFGGGESFDLLALTAKIRTGALVLDPGVERWLFLAFALAFVIKVPLFPFHTWLPDAHVEAPTAGSVMLAGVLLKMGAYGLLRFNLPLFPHVTAELTTTLCVLAVIGIIYGALVAMVQPDLKKLIAYSSVSHMGFVVLGIFAQTEQSLQGAIFQMLSHGVATGALFLIAGIIYDRRHTRLIEDFGGLAQPMPVYSAIFVVICLASMGLPLLSGFVGEFLVLVGTFNSPIAHARTFASLAATGMLLSALYLLWMLRRVVFGRVTQPENEALTDVDGRERAVLLPTVALVVLLGVLPNYFLRPTEAAVRFVRQASFAALPERGN